MIVQLFSVQFGDVLRRICTMLMIVTLTTLCSGGAQAASQSAITVTDMKGRQVTLAKPAQRVVLAEGRHILTLGLLYDNPVSHVVGWGDDLNKFSPETYQSLVKAFPEAKDVPVVGSLLGGSFSMEAVIAARPDLVIFTLTSHQPQDLKKLDNAGVPYVFIDFYQKPLENTVPSIKLLAKALGRQAQAEAFIQYYESHMQRISDGVLGHPKVSIFLHLLPNGKDCCRTSGRGNLTDFMHVAGGENIAVDKIPGATGQLNLEYVLKRDPDFYLATGGSTFVRNSLSAGTSVPKPVAEDSMARILTAPAVAGLRSVRGGRSGGIWIFFFDNPLHFVGVEALAKMFHPDAFVDADPDQTLRELNARYLAFPLEGAFWVGQALQ